MPTPANDFQPPMTVVLAFDCTVSGMGVAVSRDGACLAVHREDGRDQAARLLPAIADVLREGRVERRDVSLLAVTVGPGSFTGVRVGLAAARGLAVGLGVPLAGIATTAVLLAQAPRGDRLVVAAIDSRLGDWFCALSEGDGAPFLTSTAALAERLHGRPSLVMGEGAERLAAALDDAIAEPTLPDPAVLACLAFADGVAGWRQRNQAEGLPRPLYLRGVNVTLPGGVRRTVE